LACGRRRREQHGTPILAQRIGRNAVCRGGTRPCRDTA
jgi:hypothetical protein